jgi:histidine triad (HIT) family protein
MADCLFCKIAAGDIPSARLYEDETVLAIADINPQAPTHILVMPKAHVESVDALDAQNAGLAAACLAAIPGIAKAEGLERGYRVISNVGVDGGQSVPHLHFHVLGGKPLGERLV